MGHIILFEELEFRGRHRHVVAAEPDLALGMPFAWSGGPSSFVIVAGVWQPCGEPAFGRPHAPLFGPGLYVWAELQGLPEGSVASLRPVEAPPTVPGDPPAGSMTLFQHSGLGGEHHHIFLGHPGPGATPDRPTPFPARSALVEWAAGEAATWELEGAGDRLRLGPGVHESLDAAGLKGPVAAARIAEAAAEERPATAGQQELGHVILFEAEGFRGAHRHVHRPVSDLMDDPARLSRVGSFWVEFGAWAFYRQPGFRESLPSWRGAALLGAAGPVPPYFAPDRQAWPRSVSASRAVLTSDAPRSLSLPRPDLYVVWNDAGDQVTIAVVAGVRAVPRLWVDGAELTHRLRLRHEYDGWAGLWCLDLEIPARRTPEVRAEAAAAGPYGTGEVSVIAWPETCP
jgi:hypothetical protein